jgi:hypothetical protein
LRPCPQLARKTRKALSVSADTATFQRTEFMAHLHGVYVFVHRLIEKVKFDFLSEKQNKFYYAEAWSDNYYKA